MLKKIPSLIFAALTALTLTLAPAQNAAAWDKVCVHLKLWKAWYSATFDVAYDFDTKKGMPSIWRDKYSGHGFRLPKALNGVPSSEAHGLLTSSQFAVNQSRCVDISHIPQGTPFVVFVLPALGSVYYGNPLAVCETHHTNPHPWYHQQNRPYRELWYDAWGTTLHPKCAFVRER